VYLHDNDPPCWRLRGQVRRQQGSPWRQDWQQAGGPDFRSGQAGYCYK